MNCGWTNNTQDIGIVGPKRFLSVTFAFFLMSELLLDMRVSWTDITMWAQNKNEHGLEEKSEAEASKEPVWTL